MIRKNKIKITETLTTWYGCFLGYLFYGVSGIFFVLFSFPLMPLYLFFPKFFNRFISHVLKWYTSFLTKVFLPVFQVYRIGELTGFDKIEAPSIIVANHNGKLDGPFILGLVKDTVAVMKSKYAKFPTYALLVKFLDFVRLDLSTTEEFIRSLNDAKRVVSMNKNLLIFPEGTRSSSGKVFHFKDSAFRLAAELNVPVVPVVVYSKVPFMVKKPSSFFPTVKNIFALKALEPITVSKEDEPGFVASTVRKSMVKELAEMNRKYR